MRAQLSGVFERCTGLVGRVRCGCRVLSMYADRARDLIVSAGFIGSLERREALVNLLGRTKLPTASRIRFAGDPYLWEGASETCRRKKLRFCSAWASGVRSGRTVKQRCELCGVVATVCLDCVGSRR